MLNSRKASPFYERGEVLRDHCDRLLRQAEAKVEKITLGGDGSQRARAPGYGVIRTEAAICVNWVSLIPGPAAWYLGVQTVILEGPAPVMTGASRG